MTTLQRIYNTKDVDMLIAIDTIIDAAIANKAFLQTKRSTWGDPYFEDIKTKINAIVQTHLGIDGTQSLRQSTQIVKTIQANALKDLAELKVQLVVDFSDVPAKKTEILNQLGFTPYFATAQTKDQEALINLLFQYKTNLTAVLKAEIVAKGTAAATLDAIASYADSLRDANVTQEGNKGSRKVITVEDITAFNAIYNEVSGIAKIANNFFKGNAAVQAQFSFSKVAKTLNNTPAKKKEATPVV
jgi:hypothetical protein